MTPDQKKPDFQTISLFLTLAILTGFFVFGLKWILLTPESKRTPVVVEGASK
jgi:hypothetical protein